MVSSLPRFPDIANHWARPFIEALAERRIINGFPNGTFRPDQPISRAQFAALITTALRRSSKRTYVPFLDVDPRHWAAKAIQKAYETGFLSGYPGKRFYPNAGIRRVEALISLASALTVPAQITTNARAALAQIYQDAGDIPTYALEKLSKATAAELVVNVPDLSKLRPTARATRAEVATFLYQTLEYLGEVLPIYSPYIVRYQNTVNVSHQREFRGVWIATVWNIDWPSQRGLPVDQQKQELLKLIDRAQSLNFNAIILQVRPTGDAFYFSTLEPWSEWLTGTEGKAPAPFYDPLEFAIEECHRRNLELHAWFNPYRARISSQRTPNVAPHLAVKYPEYVYSYGDYLWMDPGAQVVQDWVYNIILDVVRRYDVDGIHLDDYFYPYPKPGVPFPDEKTYKEYQAKGGKFSLGDWRRNNVNQMVQRLSQGIHRTKSYVKFGISPFGIYRPGNPAQIKGLDQYDALFADPKKWLEEGWVDYISPQLYWRIDQFAQSYPVLLKWWTQNNPQRKHIYPGNYLSKLDGQSWPLQEYNRQVEITRNLAEDLSLGNVFYSMKPLRDNRLGVVNYFQTSLYQEPALVPTMDWIGGDQPAVPQKVQGSNGKIRWSPPLNEQVRSWTVYQQRQGSWKLERIVSGKTTEISVNSGTYALCAVNPRGEESVGVVVYV